MKVNGYWFVILMMLLVSYFTFALPKNTKEKEISSCGIYEFDFSSVKSSFVLVKLTLNPPKNVRGYTFNYINENTPCIQIKIKGNQNIYFAYVTFIISGNIKVKAKNFAKITLENFKEASYLSIFIEPKTTNNCYTLTLNNNYSDILVASPVKSLFIHTKYPNVAIIKDNNVPFVEAISVAEKVYFTTSVLKKNNGKIKFFINPLGKFIGLSGIKIGNNLISCNNFQTTTYGAVCNTNKLTIKLKKSGKSLNCNYVEKNNEEELFKQKIITKNAYDALFKNTTNSTRPEGGDETTPTNNDEGNTGGENSGATQNSNDCFKAQGLQIYYSEIDGKKYVVSSDVYPKGTAIKMPIPRGEKKDVKIGLKCYSCVNNFCGRKMYVIIAKAKTTSRSGKTSVIPGIPSKINTIIRNPSPEKSCDSIDLEELNTKKYIFCEKDSVGEIELNNWDGSPLTIYAFFKNPRIVYISPTETCEKIKQKKWPWPNKRYLSSLLCEKTPYGNTLVYSKASLTSFVERSMEAASINIVGEEVSPSPEHEQEEQEEESPPQPPQVVEEPQAITNCDALAEGIIKGEVENANTQILACFLKNRFYAHLFYRDVFIER